MINKEIDAQILKFCKENRKLDAVKFYKELTGAGLAESKDYVDNLAENASKKSLEKPATTLFSTENNLDNQILTLIQKGQKLQAIKLHLDNTKTSLLESKNYVEDLAEKNGFEKTITTNVKPNNYLIVGALFAVLMALIVFFMAK